ncbi:CotH kinase family protein [Bacteroides xylanisolvens]|uniref:CotH kinase family protein n=1 Tax=Bacteroides xylanisolvens TaxID=371601 RepID=UPI0038327BE4
MRIQKYSSGCLLSALITVLAAGCADTDVLSGGKERIEITAETAPCSQAGSRSQIDEAGSTAGVTGILWSVDDQIGVFGKSTVNAPFEGTHTEPAATATFTGEVTSGDTPLHAYYPYREDATDAAAIPVTVAVEQYWTGAASISDNDIKASSTVTRRGDSWHFAFRPMVAMLRFEVDASGVDGVSTDEPALTGKVKAYACIAPVIRSGQVLQIHLATDKHRISFRVTARQDLAAGGCYDIPLHLAAATVEENGLTIEDITAGEEPEILSFGFEAARNKGKILAREAYYDGSKTTVRSVTGQELTVTTEEGNPQGEISGCIPYLYDFTLVPTFTVTEGATVTVDGAEQTSGVSAQDFRSPVTYTVTAGGMSRDYVVTVTNTGLPVVVMTGNSGGSVQFLDMTVPAKSADFTETDRIAIYENGVASLAEMNCGFRLRGNSTSNFPKKPLAIKLASKTEVLGMKKHKRWCLLANWIDRSLMRNGVAFDIADKVRAAFSGTDAPGLPWQPHGKSVELVLNGVHVGNYFLCEQIKIDKNRLAIQDGFEDVVKDGGTATTANCGYLLEFDDNYDEYNKFRTSYCNLPCQSKDVITDNTIWNYVKNWVQDIETKLHDGNYTGAYEKLDINSVADYWIVQELTMNNEYRHPKSVYMYKDGTGKLCAGPVWDFDYQTFPNIENINAINRGYGHSNLSFGTNTLLYTQYSYTGGNDGDAPYMWYPQLFGDATFRATVKSRWQTLYPVLQGVTATIDRLGEANRLSDTYNQRIWPIESRERTGYGWYIDFSGDERLDYDKVIENMKACYTERLNNMNTAINGLK